MSLGFNLSTKKDDVSTRLKVHDIKRAKNETKKLEHEGKKMEERLMELKLAMNREKEERERHGGGFWKTGQQGTLNNYAEEVLAKKKNKSASKTKIKILKDKPLDLPERSNQPGTIAYIAQRGNQTPRDKPKGPKCGQCEERKAAVTCQQCAEDYCAGCFAAFHLKGNLKKHRSVPLMATPRQCFASPRPSQSQSSYDFEQGDGATVAFAPNSARKKGRNSPEGASGNTENSLLYGDYNEAEQAASFQEALDAWRQGRDPPSSGQSVSRKAPTPRDAPTPRGVPYSPVQTPTVNVDSATGTVDNKQDIEIQFQSSSMTYAERLLLKKHRRTDVEQLFTPRGGDVSSSATPRYTPRQTPRQSARGSRGLIQEPSATSLKIEEFNDDDFNDGERMDFQALYQAVRSTQNEPLLQNDPDSISIVEVQENTTDAGIEHGQKYMVQEEGESQLWSTGGQPATQSQFDVKPPKSGKSSRKKSGRRSARLSVEKTDTSPSIGSGKSETATDDSNSRLLGARLNDIENEIRKDERIKGSSRDSRLKTPEPNMEISLPPKSVTNKNSKSSNNDQGSLNNRPESSKSRPKSAKSRPQTSSRAKSRHENVQSRQGSRPGSRSNSRMSSRAASRLENPGLLTKAPSSALQEIARMTPTSETYKGIDSFFMVGVQPSEEQGERTLTPTKDKGKKDEKIKVSYQLYNMAPRSWKPDFSMADTVPADDVDTEEAEDDRASSVMAYHAYSEQMVSDITERLISRFGELPVDEDSLSDRSSGGAYRSLGEEYRTFTPQSHSHNSSVHNSPPMSARATPVMMNRPQGSDPAPPSRRSVRDPPTQTPRQTAQTPRQSTTRQGSSRERTETPRHGATSRTGGKTPRRSEHFQDLERPVSRAIVMEGTDLSIYDTVGEKETRNCDDEETLDQLEWELASESGRITADGKISGMEGLEPESDDSLDNSVDTLRSLSRLGQDHGYDINSKLRKDELEDDDSTTIGDDELDVRNLM